MTVNQIVYRVSSHAVVPEYIGLYVPKNLQINTEDFSLPHNIIASIRDYCNGAQNPDMYICNSDYEKHLVIESPCYAFFALDSEEKLEYAAYLCRLGGFNRFWLDGEFYNYAGNRALYTFSLSKGRHYFVWEYFSFEKLSDITIRISLFEKELKEPLTGLFHNNLFTKRPQVDIVDLSHDFSATHKFCFFLTCGDRLRVDMNQAVTFSVQYYEEEKQLKTGKIHFYEKAVIDLSSYTHDDYILLKFIYVDWEGQAHEILQPFYLHNLAARRDKALFAVQKYCQSNLTIEERCFLQDKININLYNQKNGLTPIYDSFYLEGDLRTVQTGIYKKNVSSSGHFDGFFVSALDNQLCHYCFYIPQNYQATKKYPLLIRYATALNASTTHLFPDQAWEQSFVIDIKARGVTLGSYIGEASFLETLKTVLDKYSIDATRIYGFGFSAGASGIFSLAEEYPHLFAAIAVYGGELNVDKVRNLYNTAVFQIESEADRLKKQPISLYKPLFKEHPGYSLIYADHFRHNMLEAISINVDILNQMMQYQRIDFPTEIDFTANSLRHARSFWIEINSFASQNENGRIIAKVDTKGVDITAFHVRGFSILVPPGVSGVARINGKDVCKIASNRIYNFEIDKNEEFCEIAIPVKGAIYEGMGMLDVYFSPLMIVNCIPDNPFAQQTANAFSRPQTNTYSHHIQISYPILSQLPMDADVLRNHAFIIIDSNTDHPFLKQLREKSVIKMNEQGFETFVQQYKGDYCIMQVISNSLNPQHSILYINTNCPELLERNFLTRKVILPTYVYGKHPILNKNFYIFVKEN